jgi:hypothetical protein
MSLTKDLEGKGGSDSSKGFVTQRSRCMCHLQLFGPHAARKTTPHRKPVPPPPSPALGLPHTVPYGGHHQSLTAKYELIIKTPLFARKVSVAQGGTNGDGTRMTRVPVRI